MKKIISLLLLLAISASALSGCFYMTYKIDEESPEIKKEIKPETESDPEIDLHETLLRDADWAVYDEVIGEDVGMTFTEDGEYYYNCDCGEPVGDSDIYDRYSYDVPSQTIHLSGTDGEKDEISVLYLDEYCFIAHYDGETLVFENRNSELDAEPLESAKAYLDDDMAYLTVLDYKDGQLTVAPFNYDRDAHLSFEGMIYTLECEDDAAFSSVSLTVENGEETLEYASLGEDEYDGIGEYNTSGYLSFTDDGTVDEVVFYGALIIW